MVERAERPSEQSEQEEYVTLRFNPDGSLTEKTSTDIFLQGLKEPSEEALLAELGDPDILEALEDFNPDASQQPRYTAETMAGTALSAQPEIQSGK